MTTRIAVLGDVHSRFDAHDVDHLDSLGLDAVVCVGDLGGMRASTAIATAKVMSTLRTPCFVILGNHDGATWDQIVAEAMGQRTIADRLCRDMGGRVAAIEAALSPARSLGFEGVDIGEHVHVVAARPHAMGGGLSFAAHLGERFGVDSFDASAQRIRSVARQAPSGRRLVFLAHNGPGGLGETRDAPFGRDFHPGAGDWGDPDLAEAVVDTLRGGQDVALVVAGHMHHELKGGGLRRTVGRLGGVPVVNAARVPRIDRHGRRHHVRVEIDAQRVVVTEVLVGGASRVLVESGP